MCITHFHTYTVSCILYPIFAFLVLQGDGWWEALEPGQWNVSINSKSIMLWRTSSFDATMHCVRSRKIFSIPYYVWSVTHSCSNPHKQPCSDICNSRILYITVHTMIPLLVFPVCLQLETEIQQRLDGWWLIGDHGIVGTVSPQRS